MTAESQRSDESDSHAADVHPLLRFRRTRDTRTNAVTVDHQVTGSAMPAALLGNFFEHLSFATLGGVAAELLANPTFSRQHNLSPTQVNQLLGNGEALVRRFLGAESTALFDSRWVTTPLATGFGVAIFDDATASGVPLPWSPLGSPGRVATSVGRLGGAVRLMGGPWDRVDGEHWSIDDGPSGIRQGMFVPTARTERYDGSVHVRIATDGPAEGEVEIGLRRRLTGPDGNRRPGEPLARTRVRLAGTNWQRLPFELRAESDAIHPDEPVDFYLRWIPRSRPDMDLLVDRVSLLPDDRVNGLDKQVIDFVRQRTVPQLRWPGGNFVSFYHWRDGVGPIERRPTYPNRAWGGLEYNLIGTDEYLAFCASIGAEPHITVNSGTGTPEEAAAWVEYCNGPTTTPMGRLRATNGHPEPYNVRIWEVGNENYGSWQGGYVGAEENAIRFGEFARVMRAASPIPIQLLACGNAFDFAEPAPGYDQVTADQRWHSQLLEHAADDIDLISLHALPSNDRHLEACTDREAHEAVLAQVTSWERRFLPDLLRRCDDARRDEDRSPIQLAMTEWGPLGRHRLRLMVENFGGSVWAGTFLNLLLRNADRIPMASPNGFMHGGCIRKAAGTIFTDPMFDVIQEYASFVGSTPLRCDLAGPGYDVDHAADMGAVEADVPYVDVIACRPPSGDGLLLAAANRHLTETMDLQVSVANGALPAARAIQLSYPELAARATPAQPNRFPMATIDPDIVDGTMRLSLPPSSITWIGT